MLNFNYRNPTHVVFGKDRIAELDQLVPANAKVLITYGGGSVVRFGTLDKVKAALGKRTVIEFGGIEANPKYDTLMQAVEVARKQNIDFILAVGGGSVMDGSKFIALATQFDGDTTSLLHHGFAPVPVAEDKVIPLGVIATLPATGSEMNAFAVVSYQGGKFPVNHPNVYPTFAMLDPELTFSLPQIQVANGVVDAFVHVLEQYATYPVDARVQDRTAEGIMRTLIEIGPITIAEPTNYEARANLMWSATSALNGMIGVGVPFDWTTHMIGHELTAIFNIDHAQTLAVVLPSVWRVLKTQKQAKLLQYAERVWDITAGDDDSRVEQAIVKTEAFFQQVGLKTRLRDHGVEKAQIETVINALEAHGMTALSETGKVDLAMSRKILEMAW
ncbi:MULTISPECIES: iron-containing alcohol dehydrogenase [Pseudomonadati]|uniref:Iron-containing alcohol dehydrogenase n=1 Tax=Shewanella aestuarii TaxID=1028752 RepID=A0ABT0L486_9GAMM|nr:iron-containing alcohol dehydrogenase [Shewanella aestuarii]MCL1118536.1 iron-containing alcohol dehydrogenase [Shewanella aestuarii]GGN82992.1 NADH-dependent alcohol dehydrogenase [Shewanella aestuarii]